MGLVLHLEKRHMGSEAQAIFAAAEAGQTLVHIPAMVLAEMLYLAEKGRIFASLADVEQLLKTCPHFCECAMSRAIIEAAAEITDIRELHDRLIAATGR